MKPPDTEHAHDRAQNAEAIARKHAAATARARRALKRQKALPRVRLAPPAVRCLRRVVFADQSQVVFSTRPGLTTREAVLATGTPLYKFVAGRWRRWSSAVAPWRKDRPSLWTVPVARPAPALVTFANAACAVAVETWRHLADERKAGAQ